VESGRFGGPFRIGSSLETTLKIGCQASPSVKGETVTLLVFELARPSVKGLILPPSRGCALVGWSDPGRS
jgi:hypothetical protein